MRFTEELKSVRSPLTVGILLALVSAAGWGWGLWDRYRNDQAQAIREALDVHDGSYRSHPDIRQAINDMAERSTERYNQCLQQLYLLRDRKGARR